MSAGKSTKNQSRRASSDQSAAMERLLSGLMPDSDGTAALKAACEDGEESSRSLTGDLPDEEREAVRKVDFSVLEQMPPAFFLFPDEIVKQMDVAQATAYAISLGKALKAYQKIYLSMAKQLANARELVLNGQNALFGRSSQRFSALMGKGKKTADDAKKGKEALDSKRL